MSGSDPPVTRRRLRLPAALAGYLAALAAETDEAPGGWEAAVQALYASCYRSRRHGHRDDRPQHWRQYLAPEDRADA